MTQKKTCDLCGGCEFERIATSDRKQQPLDTDVCRTCGLVRHAQIPTDDELAEFYGSQYRQDYHGETTPSDRRVMRAWKNGRRIYQQLWPYLKQGDRILEIGAGIGCNVKAFEVEGWESCGIEPHEGFCEYGSQVLRSPLQRQSLEDLPQEPIADVILLVHVIEHFKSPRQALERIRGLLRPGGRLYIECPNLAAPFAPRGKLFHYAHIHNFTPQTLRLLAESCGYRAHTLFSAAADPNLQMLVEADTVSPRGEQPTMDAGGCDETLRALNRFNWLTYHARWSYAAPRIAKLATYLYEHLTARRFVRELVHECRRSPAPPSASRAA